MMEILPGKTIPSLSFWEIFEFDKAQLGTRSSQDETPDSILLSWFRNTISSQNYYFSRDYKNEPCTSFKQEIKSQKQNILNFRSEGKKIGKMIDPLADLYEIVSSPPPKKQKQPKSADKKKSKLVTKVAKAIKRALLWQNMAEILCHYMTKIL